MSQLVKPHGSDVLLPRLLEGAALAQAQTAAANLKRVQLSSRERGDLIMLGIGGFTPLAGFMGKADWQGVCDKMQLANGLFWPIPITLSTDQATADGIAIGEKVALVDADGVIMGALTVEEKYSIDKAHECQQVFTTTDAAHPGVQQVMAQEDVNLAGAVEVYSEGEFPSDYAGIYLRPAETRALFEKNGWKTVAAFQTRNPMHRSHEHLAKIAVELCDGLMVHSLLGQLKPGDIPAAVRQKAIGTLIDKYFVKNTVVQSGYPLDMRYAGPREALLHALFRQNYGCSHLVVGRDHAGVGDYYGPFDAQLIFDTLPKGALITQPIRIGWTFWCNKCGTMSSMRSCPHDDADRVLVSGTKLRKALSEGGEVPDNFSRPEVLDILREYYATLEDDQKVKIELKGASAR